MKITVTLDPASDPPVTCSPQIALINPGSEKIMWLRGEQQDFTFDSLSALPDPPFTKVIVGSTQMSAHDDNKGAAEYVYSIGVFWNGGTYSTQSRQRGRGKVGGASDPAIKNK